MRLISYLTPGFPATLFEAVGEVIGADLLATESIGPDRDVEGGLSGPPPGDDPLSDGRADLAWVCSTSYVDLAARPHSAVRPVGVAWVPVDADSAGRPLYFSDLVVRPDSGLTHVADLRGCRIGCNDPMSLSGYHALRFELLDRGLEPERFAVLTMTGGHRSSLDRLLAGELDAAVVDSVLLSAWARREPEIGRLHVVRRLGPWPTQPLIAAERLGEDVIARIRERLLAAGDSSLRDEMERMGLRGLTRVGDDHCAPVADAMSRPAEAQPAVTQSGPKYRPGIRSER